LRLNDRLHAPNTAAVYAEFRQHLAPFLVLLYPGLQVSVAQVGAPTDALTMHIKAPENPPVSTLLGRLERSTQPT
jgi:hypothetical protein